MRAAVLGHPISHSLSPALHNAAYQALGLDWQYEALDIIPAELPELLTNKLLNSDNWAGFSITMPLKPEIVPWLSSANKQFPELSANISPLVVATNAANTLVKRSPLELFAEKNTDIAGIVAALREANPCADTMSKIAILGAGATAASALAAAQELGAELVVVYTRATTNLQPLREVAARLDTEFQERDIVNAARELSDFDVVISTMPKFAADPIASELRAAQGILLDVIYDPRPTALQTKWSALGGSTVGGERMLLHQAARQVELMTGLPAPLGAMDAALLAALRNR